MYSTMEGAMNRVYDWARQYNRISEGIEILTTMAKAFNESGDHYLAEYAEKLITELQR